VASDLVVTLPRSARDKIAVTLKLDTPVPAPVAAGQSLGVVEIKAPDMPTISYPVVAGSAIPGVGFFGRFVANIQYLLGGG